MDGTIECCRSCCFISALLIYLWLGITGSTRDSGATNGTWGTTVAWWSFVSRWSSMTFWPSKETLLWTKKMKNKCEKTSKNQSGTIVSRFKLNEKIIIIKAKQYRQMMTFLITIIIKTKKKINIWNGLP